MPIRIISSKIASRSLKDLFCPSAAANAALSVRSFNLVDA